jgi:transcription elongation GreA/GreB family factor
VAGVYTHHIEVKQQLTEESASDTSSQSSVLHDQLNGTHASAALIEVGDLITLSYADAPQKLLRYRLTHGSNDLKKGPLSVREPLGTALVGASEAEEITVKIGGHERQC